MTIPEIHEILFQILIKLDEPFLLRPNQPAHAEFLKQGYWFLGAKQSVYTSFWAGLGDATLVFRVYEDCSCVLEFKQHHSISLALPDLPFGWLDFQLNELAELIDLELVTHKHWIKKYPSPDIWDSIQLFLQKDKPIINEFIRTRKLTAILPPIDGIDFQNNLKTPAICLIDEADTYLHPKWEQKILSVLTQHFTHTQFIITTHSPLILANLKDNYRIYKIEKAKNNEMIVVEHPRHRFNPYGAESSRILRLLMMTQERPDEVAQLIAKYQNAILNNDFENAQSFENQLKILIDASDPVLIEGEASLEARKMLQNL
jgi:AAA domain, putative AbiEii toxin, Type IV TA system